MTILPLNVLTIATGKTLYLDMAVNLARSFRWWNKDNGIKFYLATDMADQLPQDTRPYIEVIQLRPDELGKGFSTKLHLDKLAPSGQTLFIDSDCLIYGDLTDVFTKFKGHAVSVIGSYIDHGDWFGSVNAVCKRFGIPHLPKFNGGIYYLESGAEAKAVYEQARELESAYDEIGFTRLRGRPNDEVLMALSMQLNGQIPLKEDGTILAEFVNFATGISSDLLNGKVALYNKPGHQHYQANWPLTKASPLIVHFLGHHNQKLPYLTEANRLKYIYVRGYSTAMAKLLTGIRVTVPRSTATFIKDIFRPVYRAIWGTREIKTSERIIH